MKDKDPGIPQTSGRVVVEQVLSSPSLLELAQTRCAAHVLVDAIKGCDTVVKDAQARDAHGRTLLHYLASYEGSEDAIEALFAKAGDEASSLVLAIDSEGCTPLHHASASLLPMASFQLALQAPEACIQPQMTADDSRRGSECISCATKGTDGQGIDSRAGTTPIDLATETGSCETLNALLLACSSSSSEPCLEGIRRLVKAGAVPDTWAPSGQSSLMIAAAADNPEGIKVLLENGATLELQDALGRTALMWAAGSSAPKSLKELLKSGACIATRDRRGKVALDYASEFPEVKTILENHVEVMENKAKQAQDELLAELMAEEEHRIASKASKKARKKAAKQRKRATAQTEKVGSLQTPEHKTETDKAEDDNKMEKCIDSHSNLSQSVFNSSTVAASENTTKESKSNEKFQVIPLGKEDTKVAEEEKDVQVPSQADTICGHGTNCISKSSASSPSKSEWCTVVPKKGSIKKKFLKQGSHHRTQVTTSAEGQDVNKNTSQISDSDRHPTGIYKDSSCTILHPQSETRHRRHVSSCSVTSTGSLFSYGTEDSVQLNDRCVISRATASSNGTATPPHYHSSDNCRYGNTEVSGKRSMLHGLGIPISSNLKRDSVSTIDSSANDCAVHMPSISEKLSDGKSACASWATVAALSATRTISNPRNSGSKASEYLSAKSSMHMSKHINENKSAEVASCEKAWEKEAPLSVHTKDISLLEEDSEDCFESWTNNKDSNVRKKNLIEEQGAISDCKNQENTELNDVRMEMERLRSQLAAVEVAHRREIAAILRDAAQHESFAVARASQEVRNECIVRFASFLQNNGHALAAALPSLLSSSPPTWPAANANESQMYSKDLSQAKDDGDIVNLSGEGISSSGSMPHLWNNNNSEAGNRIQGGDGTVEDARHVDISAGTSDVDPTVDSVADTWSSLLAETKGAKMDIMTMPNEELDIYSSMFIGSNSTTPLSSSPFSHDMPDYLRSSIHQNPHGNILPSQLSHHD